MKPAIDRLIEKLGVRSATDLATRARSYIAIDAAMDSALGETRNRVLASAVALYSEGQTLAVRGRDTARAMAEVGFMLSESWEAKGTGEQDPLLHEVIALALANFGSYIRWSAMVRGEPSVSAIPHLNALYRRAERLGVSLATAPITRDGLTRRLTPEAHYIRALLLSLLCHEALDPQQLEVVDGWLWNWVASYRLTRHCEGTESSLWIDLAGRTGLCLSDTPEGKDVRHLVIDRMEHQIEQVKADLRAGRRAYPGVGCAASFDAKVFNNVLHYLDHLREQLSPASFADEGLALRAA